jgi:hypothetical protein
MNDQLALAGPATPPNLHLTRRQRFALEFIAQRPCSSEELGAALHAYRLGEGKGGHLIETTCRWCQPEGAAMGARLREFKLVRFARNLKVWYLEENGRPQDADKSAQTDEIPF